MWYVGRRRIPAHCRQRPPTGVWTTQRTQMGFSQRPQVSSVSTLGWLVQRTKPHRDVDSPRPAGPALVPRRPAGERRGLLGQSQEGIDGVVREGDVAGKPFVLAAQAVVVAASQGQEPEPPGNAEQTPDGLVVIVLVVDLHAHQARPL